MNGMTLKQFAKARFFAAVDRFHEARKDAVSTPERRREYVEASLAVHAAKGGVPKRYWPMVNRKESQPCQ